MLLYYSFVGQGSETILWIIRLDHVTMDIEIMPDSCDHEMGIDYCIECK